LRISATSSAIECAYSTATFCAPRAGLHGCASSVSACIKVEKCPVSMNREV
jgi:hypothetical protein